LSPLLYQLFQNSGSLTLHCSNLSFFITSLRSLLFHPCFVTFSTQILYMSFRLIPRCIFWRKEYCNFILLLIFISRYSSLVCKNKIILMCWSYPMTLLNLFIVSRVDFKIHILLESVCRHLRMASHLHDFVFLSVPGWLNRTSSRTLSNSRKSRYTCLVSDTGEKAFILLPKNVLLAERLQKCYLLSWRCFSPKILRLCHKWVLTLSKVFSASIGKMVWLFYLSLFISWIVSIDFYTLNYFAVLKWSFLCISRFDLLLFWNHLASLSWKDISLHFPFSFCFVWFGI
jgi:hypothetical protein